MNTIKNLNWALVNIYLHKIIWNVHYDFVYFMEILKLLVGKENIQLKQKSFFVMDEQQ